MYWLTEKQTRQQVIDHLESFGLEGVGHETSGNTVVWWPDATPEPTHDYSKDYLTFRAQESGTFKFSGSSASNTLQYSLDNGGTWTTLAHNTDSPTVQPGNTIMFKASGLTIGNTSGIGQFISTGQFEAEGNAMSLVFGDDFSGQTSLNGKDYVFLGLFSGCTGLTSAENLSLPATTLTVWCYEYMFRGCTSLTTAPELPATTLAGRCYYYMFYGCTSLITGPSVLPATTLADWCYNNMFYGCTGLTTAPELPATTLAERCYNAMFQNCTSLTTAPELPATTLAERCYYAMFNGCTSLNYIKCLATDISASNCTSYWVTGVAATGTFVKASTMSGWTTGTSGIPSGWTVQNAT